MGYLSDLMQKQDEERKLRALMTGQFAAMPADTGSADAYGNPRTLQQENYYVNRVDSGSQDAYGNPRTLEQENDYAVGLGADPTELQRLQSAVGRNRMPPPADSALAPVRAALAAIHSPASRQPAEVQPQGMPELQPNSFRNERTGVVTQLSAPDTKPWVDPSRIQVVDEQLQRDGTTLQLIKVPIINSAGQQSMTTQFRVMRPNSLNPAWLAEQKSRKTEADIAHTQAETTRAQAIGKQATIPAGYRRKNQGDPNSDLEPIPGGPADTKIQGALNQDTLALNGATDALDRLGHQVELVKNANLGRVTGLVGALPNIPGSEGSDAKGRLEALKYQVGLNVLQSMKDASRTASSGLGQITEKEHVYLQAQLGNLDKAQSESEIRRVLGDMEKFVVDAKLRISNAYNMKHKKNDAVNTQAAPMTDMQKQESIFNARKAIQKNPANAPAIRAKLRAAGIDDSGF